ncbi:MAG TPA: helical backbone metal receptor, partial [Chitinophagaceae bacterium]
PIKACYLIWKDPYMTVGGDSFIHDMMYRAGFINIYSAQRRYPEIRIEDLQRDKPEIVLLSSEPFPFKEKHAEELKRIYPESLYILVDGEMFSWYGSRLIHAADYFQQLRHEILTKFGYAASDR